MGGPLDLFSRPPLSARLLGGLALVCAVSAVGATEAPATSPPEITSAIDQLRGVRFEGLPADEKRALGERLDRAWDRLLDRPEEAKKAIVRVLATERKDDFLLVDLAHLLLVLDPDDPAPAADALGRAKVTADPPGAFHAAATMAAMHCLACLPAVLRILEVKDAETALSERAVPIDPELMLVFTLGQYGDGAIEPVTSRLSSDNCIVRGNAALALGVLQPPSIPAAIRAIAARDSCDEARARAWTALGLLDDPQLAAAAAKRLRSALPTSKVERMEIVHALGSALSPAAAGPLRTLANDPDREVAAVARRAARGLQEMARRMDRIRAMRAEVPASRHARLVRRLEKAARTGRISLDREPDDMLATLNAADVPLLNQARAAVLARLSDECLDEYFPLTHAVRALRGASAPQAAPSPAR